MLCGRLIVDIGEGFTSWNSAPVHKVSMTGRAFWVDKSLIEFLGKSCCCQGSFCEYLGPKLVYNISQLRMEGKRKQEAAIRLILRTREVFKRVMDVIFLK